MGSESAGMGGQPTGDAVWSGKLAVAGDAEASLCGALFLAPEVMTKLGRLTEDDFAIPQHRATYAALRALTDRGDPVDLTTVEAQLAKQGMLGAVGGIAGLSSYLVKVPTADNAPHYAALIRDASFNRRLHLMTSGAASRLASGAEWRDTMTGLRSSLEDLEGDAHVDPPTLRDVMNDELKVIRSRKSDVVGLMTGLGIERVCPTGIPLDKLTTVVAETGHFKTTFVNNLAWNMAEAGNTVVNISWEDSNQLGAQRALGRTTGVNYGDIAARRLDEETRAKLGVSDSSGDIASRIVMADNVEPTIDAVIRLARFYKRTRGAKAVFVDYLQLLDGHGSQKQILDDAVQKAQRSAKQDKIAYVFVSQAKAEVTNRKSEDGGPRPTLDDCLGSSAMRIGTKLGLGLFRPWRYCPIPKKGGPYSEYFDVAMRWRGEGDFLRDIYPRILEVNVTKNVLGAAPVTVHCLVDLPTGKIHPLNMRELCGL